MTAPIVVMSLIALWILVVILIVLVLLLYRQFGLVMMPSSELIRLRGLDIGARIPSLAGMLEDRDDPVTADPGFLPDGNGVIVFAGSTCPVCERLWDELVLAPESGVSGLLAWIDGDGERNGQPPEGWKIFRSHNERAHAAFKVPAVPFFYRVVNGRIVDKGLAGNLTELRHQISHAMDDRDGSS